MGDALSRATSFNEKGGVITMNKNGDQGVMAAVSGVTISPSSGKNAHIDVYNSAKPSEWGNVSSQLGTVHTHTSGTETIGNRKFGFEQSPSGQDILNAAGRGNLPLNNYVLSSSKNTVYIYNGPDTLATFPLQKFLSFGK
ncbi:MAG: hypothetical protein HF314_19190 [Ignavibacteria bacterium]|jgi:hypothetical protein|nr:hypothetical protein [Ignavibacteria bacterium]MCU7505214.1 hypothetical protein [Ignavibacteria bacterium]MCU7517292.1 hypothetical protein [Ignavibacteria bacterium]